MTWPGWARPSIRCLGSTTLFNAGSSRGAPRYRWPASRVPPTNKSGLSEHASTQSMNSRPTSRMRSPLDPGPEPQPPWRAPGETTRRAPQIQRLRSANWIGGPSESAFRQRGCRLAAGMPRPNFASNSLPHRCLPWNPRSTCWPSSSPGRECPRAIQMTGHPTIERLCKTRHGPRALRWAGSRRTGLSPARLPVSNSTN